MLRSNPKKVAVDVLDATAIAWLLSPLYRTRGIILGLHRVISQTQETLMPGNVMTVELLEELTDFLKRSKYEFVSLDEIPDRLRSRTRQRFAAITFDDGYLDNLTHALPLLRSRNAPFTVYPVTGLLDRTVEPWWVVLEALILARDEVILNHPDSGSLRLSCRTHAEKMHAYRVARRWGYKDASLFCGILRQAYYAAGLSITQVVNDTILTWDQARTLNADPLAMLGVHTVTHLPLTTLSETQATEEIAVARERLKAELQEEIRHIAYPYGQCGPREFRIAAGVGLQSGVTTYRGTVRSEHVSRLLELPRIMLGMSPHGSSVRFLRVSAHGLWNTLANWWEGQSQ